MRPVRRSLWRNESARQINHCLVEQFMGSIAERRLLVTGGNGFLGREVCRALEAFRPATIVAPRSSEYDLRDQAAVRRLLRDARPDVVVHLAAVVGGIGANRANPGRYFYENVQLHCHHSLDFCAQRLLRARGG